MASLEFNFHRWDFAQMWLSNFDDHEFEDLNRILSKLNIDYWHE